MNKILELLKEWGKPVITVTSCVIALILLLKMCGDTKISNSPLSNYEVIDEKVKQYTKSHIDTVEKIVKVPYYIEVPKRKIVFRDTIVYKDTNTNTNYPILQFKSKFEDSLISGSIFSNIKLDGTLVYQDLKYTPKFPKYIIKTDSVFITKTKIIKKTPSIKFVLGLSGSIGIKDKYYNVTPKAGILFKRGDLVTGGYDVVNNAIELQYIRIFNYNK